MNEKLKNTRSTFLLRKEIERLEQENIQLLEKISDLQIKLNFYEPIDTIKELPTNV